MAPKITNADRDKLNEILVMNGYYFGLHKITKDYDLTSDQFRKIKSGLAQHILGKIREGKQEIARLQAVVVRLEAACQAAAIVNPAEGMIWGPVAIVARKDFPAKDFQEFVAYLKANDRKLNFTHGRDSSLIAKLPGPNVDS